MKPACEYSSSTFSRIDESGETHVIDDVIDRTILFDGRIDQSLRKVLSRHIATDRQRLTAGLLDFIHDFLRFVAIEIRNDNFGAFSGKEESC